MQFKIKTEHCIDSTGLFLAEIQRGIYDGSSPKAPILIAYGESEDRAYQSLKRKLEKHGHEVVEGVDVRIKNRLNQLSLA